MARKVKALEEVEDAIHAAGGSATIAPLDLAEPDAVARLAAAVAGRWQALDILVLAAAYLPELTPTAQIDPKQFNQALLTNVVATQALIAGFDPLLRRASGGQAHRPYQQRCRRAAGLLGGLWRDQGGV
ncbi:MAG: hypothetical protein KatS3mg120_1924 [Erythrobacter sp.]|nr:MAG: hypothetical protein KatS3mg120_1924 [Erythrobacter sp.]